MPCGRARQAKRWAERAVRHSPAADWAYLVLLSNLGHLDLEEEAPAVPQTYLGRRPAFSISDIPKRMPYQRIPIACTIAWRTSLDHTLGGSVEAPYLWNFGSKFIARRRVIYF